MIGRREREIDGVLVHNKVLALQEQKLKLIFLLLRRPISKVILK